MGSRGESQCARIFGVEMCRDSDTGYGQRMYNIPVLQIEVQDHFWSASVYEWFGEWTSVDLCDMNGGRMIGK